MASLKMLDLAFAMDCTGSMGSYIQQAQDSIREIASEIVRVEKADLQLGLIEYRDHPPQESTFVTNVLDFTWSLRDMKERLDACSANGGGDTPEAVVDAMHALLKLNWRPEATKVCVFIADAPPHCLGCSGDAFPETCPCGLDAMEVLRDVAEKGITLYMVGCEPSITPYRDWFMACAYKTGGQYVPLTIAKLLPKVIISGTQEEISLQELLKDTAEEVTKLTGLAGAGYGGVDEVALERAVFEKLKTSGVKTKHLKATGGDLPTITDMAIRISQQPTMAQVRAIFTPGGGTASTAAARSFGSAFAAVPSRGVFGAAAAEAPAAAAAITDYAAVESEVTYEQAARLTRRTLNTMSSTGVAAAKPGATAADLFRKE